MSDGPALYILSYCPGKSEQGAGEQELRFCIRKWHYGHLLVSVKSAGLSGTLPASCSQRLSKSKVPREAKVRRQAGRDGSREHEKQTHGLQRAHDLVRNTGREESLGFLLSSL